MSNAALCVDRRIFDRGVHIASLVPLPFEYPLGDYTERGPLYEPEACYAAQDDHELALVEAYKAKYPHVQSKGWGIENWREWTRNRGNQ